MISDEARGYCFWRGGDGAERVALTDGVMTSATERLAVLLIRPLCDGDELEFAEPLGIERLAGYLLKHGVRNVRIFDRRLYAAEREAAVAASMNNRNMFADNYESRLDAPSFYDDLRAEYSGRANRLEMAGPDVVGISLMTSSDVRDALRVMSRLASWWPDARFVVGGVYVTHASEDVARRFPRGTMLLRGEGERALLEFVRECAEQGGSRPWREGESSLVAPDVPSTNRQASLQASPPAWQEPVKQEPPSGSPQALAPDRLVLLLSPDDWARPLRTDLERYARLGCAVNMQTSRGCPGACTFCATPQQPAGLRKWQPRSMQLVANEIQFEAIRLARAGLQPVFNCVDDDFGPLTRVEELADELDRRDLRVAFALEMRMASLAHASNLAGRLERLRAAGLTRVFVGVESLNEATLERWHKRYDVNALPQVVSAFARAGVALQTGYILWHKHQTVNGARAEVETLWQMSIYSHQMALSRLIVFPGCALATRSDSTGLESLAPDAERFYRRLSDRAMGLRERWLKAALREPYLAACAWLDGDSSELDALRAELATVNRLSYEAFCEEYGFHQSRYRGI